MKKKNLLRLIKIFMVYLLTFFCCFSWPTPLAEETNSADVQLRISQAVSEEGIYEMDGDGNYIIDLEGITSNDRIQVISLETPNGMIQGQSGQYKTKEINDIEFKVHYTKMIGAIDNSENLETGEAPKKNVEEGVVKFNYTVKTNQLVEKKEDLIAEDKQDPINAAIQKTQNACVYDGPSSLGASFKQGVYVYTNIGGGWRVQISDKDSTTPVVERPCFSITDRNGSGTTEYITSMKEMFTFSKASAIDVSNLDTSKVTDMSYMFSNTTAQIINVSNFNTSNVTNMSGMFGSSMVQAIDLSSFDTSNVANMEGMFAYVKVSTVDVSNFDTSNVVNMSSMFEAVNMSFLNVSNFNTSRVTSFVGMFTYAKVPFLDISNFDLSNVNVSVFNNWMFKYSKIPCIKTSIANDLLIDWAEYTGKHSYGVNACKLPNPSIMPTPSSTPRSKTDTTPSTTGKSCQDDGYPKGYYWDGNKCIINKSAVIKKPKITLEEKAIIENSKATPSMTPTSSPTIVVEIENKIVNPEIIKNIKGGYWSIFNLITIIIGAMGVIILILSKKEMEEDGIQYKRLKIYTIILLIVVLGGFIGFVLTNDITKRMVFFDQYSLLFVVLMILTILIVPLGLHWVNEEL
ncbi:MAG: BspA family leucine-rich repeat surface protein [Anaerorhabdus sp.]|uniref:BspA family leucine-rich repeat surface protein n=1 Tax=Anaerorhabdus sp. TaxID=1872524 RepID=UPI003A89389B